MNHVPTVGSVAALGLLLLGYVRRNDHLKHVGLEVLFIIALLTLPVYVSGAVALSEIRSRPDVSVDAVKIHQDARVYAAVLSGGDAVNYALPQDRRAYVHVARGAVQLNGAALSAGDGAKISGEQELKLSGGNAAEVLLFDLAGR